MDAGEDFDQLDGIPGMPETIGIGPILRSNATKSIDIRFGGVTFSRNGQIRGDVHSVLPTRGAFDLPPLPAALPEYSLESEAAAAAAAAASAAVPPRDHAASVAEEIAQKIAEGGGPDVGGRATAGELQLTPSGFRAAALQSVTGHVEIRERRAAETGTGTGKAKAPAGIDPTRVPNLWLAVAHSSDVKAGEVKKVEVDGVPIALWRTSTGSVSAQSDVCIHRGASLARGWIANDRLVCPSQVVVKNEFHLPYRAVIRVYFGSNSLKTIEATAVPRADGETTLHWKLYRNFAITHPLDEGPINKAGDFLFGQMMDLTLKEDKEIIENIYPEYQRGFMNARYDQQMLQYRKAITNFQATAAERANTQLETSLQMELLNRISRSERGLASTRGDRSAILDLIRRLEDVQATTQPPPPNAGGGEQKLAADAAAAARAATAAAAAAAAADENALRESVEGEWHLEFVSNDGGEEGAQEGWDLASSTDPEKKERLAVLKEAGSEALLFDWKETGRPLWADTSESVQIIDTKARTLTNRAVYKGWSGFTTTVQLDAVIEPLKDEASRLMVGFRKAIVNVGGMKVTFPHLQRFSPTGWMETTYLNQGIRIARGNKGSIFVLTRQPVSSRLSSSSSSPTVTNGGAANKSLFQ
ncbi:Rieske (2Fe-2S) domain protein [Ectocarpus siliculosus]|uniref:Rieske (2Fe-2S) domain protein n=1 Tax=Ectocarpus siliculosus TaxID=2880 RepID=D8LGX3_ECTSI|nr:Rieske (2Fe-2S) domain protein [Ectocarpus siliculosus]|eukprot:CBN75826.1 Rieske (2Fe-2S) domain protein [Ectocarpus siliculosus]